MKWATPSSLWNPAPTPRAEGFSEDGPSPKREESTSVSRPHRAFAFVSARIFAGSLAGPFHRRLRRIRCLLRRFDCYWASHPSQAGLPPAEIHTHSRRTDTYLNSGDAQTSLPAILARDRTRPWSPTVSPASSRDEMRPVRDRQRATARGLSVVFRRQPTRLSRPDRAERRRNGRRGMPQCSRARSRERSRLVPFSPAPLIASADGFSMEEDATSRSCRSYPARRRRPQRSFPSAIAIFFPIGTGLL